MFSALALLGQTHSSADHQFKAGDYGAAQKSYKALLRSYPSNQLYLYRYARCAQELGDDLTAIEYFKKAGNRYTLKHLYMGDSQLRLWNVEEAISEYNAYREKEPDERQEYVQKQIDYAEMLQRYLKRVERVQIIDSVDISIDSMLHVVELSAEAGHLTLDTTHSIIYTNQRGDRKIWADGNASGRILMSNQRLLDSWSRPDTFPESINFTKDQCSPYVLNDGVTIYFAAQDENGIGGLDIYVSRYNTATESYTTPENIGMPYNSPANEYMFVVDEIRKVGYLATDRFAEKGRVHVYSFAIPEYKQYWRNISHESLVEYAQLRKFELYTKEVIDVVVAEENIDETGDFSFIVNDSIVYSSTSDFKQPTAKAKYKEWKKLSEQIELERLRLEELRQQYATAEDIIKKELTPVILQLEKNQSQLSKRCQNLLLEIRAIELKER